ESFRPSQPRQLKQEQECAESEPLACQATGSPIWTSTLRAYASHEKLSIRRRARSERAWQSETKLRMLPARAAGSTFTNFGWTAAYSYALSFARSRSQVSSDASSGPEVATSMSTPASFRSPITSRLSGSVRESIATNVLSHLFSDCLRA